MENKVLKPKIRFKGFTDTWEQHKFSRLANVRRGLTYSSIDISKNGVRVLRSSNIQEDKFIYSEDDVFVNKNAINIDYVKNNDILITSANGSTRLVGKHALISGLPSSSAVHGGFMLLATANENPEFLNASMSSSWYSKFIELFVSGGNGAIGNLSKSDLDEQEILVPSSKEQKKLGQLFKMIDNLITLHQSKYDKLVNVKKALLEKMFPKDGKNVPEIRFKGFTDTWEQRKLNELTNIITKGTTPLDKVNEGTINFIKIENIDSFSGNINITSKITEEEHNSYLKRSQLKENDLLFSIAGTLGRVTVVKSDVLPANTNQALAIIRLKDGDINYIKTYLKGKTISNFIKKNPTIGAQPNLSLEQVGNFDIDMPNKEEQRKLGNLFNSIDNLITLHQHKLEKLKNMEKSLLNKMFI